jgi:hypothetical protein
MDHSDSTVEGSKSRHPAFQGNTSTDDALLDLVQEDAVKTRGLSLAALYRKGRAAGLIHARKEYTGVT